MRSFTYTIVEPRGIHARSAGILAEMVRPLNSTVIIRKGDAQAGAKQLVAVMGLNIKQGEEILVMVEGSDEIADCAKVEKFFKKYF